MISEQLERIFLPATHGKEKKKKFREVPVQALNAYKWNTAMILNPSFGSSVSWVITFKLRSFYRRENALVPVKRDAGLVPEPFWIIWRK